MKPAHAIQTLWQHAAPELPDTLLEHLACAEDNANALRNLAQSMESLASLIIADGDHPRPAGDFRDADSLPALLLGLASAIATQAELVTIATDAASLLRQQGRHEGRGSQTVQ